MISEPTKTCDGCGKDLSNDSAYPSGFDKDFGRDCTQLWRCAPCKIAKDTHRIAALEAVVTTSMSDLGNLAACDPTTMSRGIDGASRMLTETLTDYSYPSIGRKKDES